MDPAKQNAERNPLKDTGILQQVFSYVPGHWLFLGAVCREWEAVYASITDQQLRPLNGGHVPKRCHLWQ
jgi:hypothetical protein